MKSFTINAIAAVAMVIGALGLAGAANAAPWGPLPQQPGDEQQAEGDDAMMMVSRAMYDCMWGSSPGIPRAVLNDRGVMFTCHRGPQ